MPDKASLTAASPRLFGHAIVLLVLVAAWAAPRAAAGTPPSGRTRLAAEVVAPAADPVQAMAVRARLSTRVLPVTGEPAVVRAAAPAPRAGNPPAKTAAARPPVHAAPPAQPVPAPAPQAGWANDISWPQCDGDYPSGPHDTGVVGVTGGRPFTSNPCLASEFAWARGSRMAGGAQLYVNLELDGSSSGPHQCGADDHLCRAYDYGWLTVDDAFNRANAVGVSSSFWWLDVEVGNNWSDVHDDFNMSTVRGAIDAVRSHGAEVGIYSSVDQWAQILPAAYHPGVATWLAVVGDSTMAPGLCGPGHSLTGGPVYMVQYDDHVFDKDHVCAAGSAAFAQAASRHPH